MKTWLCSLGMSILWAGASASDTVQFGPFGVTVQQRDVGPDMVSAGPATGPLRSAPLNRSRGVEDVVRVAASGGMLFAGREWLDQKGRWHTSPVHSVWLDDGLWLRRRGPTLEIHSSKRTCSWRLPEGWQLEDTPQGSLARLSASDGTGRVEMMLVASPKQGRPGRFQPHVLSMTGCQVHAGEVLESPAFDLLMWGYRDADVRFALMSMSENTVHVSKDGLSWRALDLPPNTHTLQSVYAQGGDVWVAITDAQRDFATTIYRRRGDGGAWEAWSPEAQKLPTGWFGGAWALRQP